MALKKPEVIRNKAEVLKQTPLAGFTQLGLQVTLSYSPPS